MNEYVYILHQKIFNEFKIGSTKNFEERMTNYITSCSEFNNETHEILLYKLKKCKLSCYKIDSLINKMSSKKNVPFTKHNGSGGTEFYKKADFKNLNKFFDKIGIKYNEEKIDVNELRSRIKKLKRKEVSEKNKNDEKNKRTISDDEFNEIEKKIINDELNVTENKSNELNIKPQKHQQEILDKIEHEYKNNKILKLYWTCGLGKTLLSIFICKKMNYKKVCIGVPSIYLQEQFYNEILKVYPRKENILLLKDKKKIINFLNDNEIKFIITTYTSCNLLVDEEIKFDIKIGDECHHLVGIEKEEIKSFRDFHKIKSENTFYMTATKKNMYIKENKKIIYSMDDNVKFGKLIDEKNTLWAIKNKKITDYKIIIIKNEETEINELMLNLDVNIQNKELFTCALIALKKIETYDDLTHILICCNTTKNADLVNEYINVIINKNILKIKSVYKNSIHSNKKTNINEEIIKFKNSENGIITSVQLFAEGFDLPRLNGVMFAENMISDIRILQTALRPNRLDTNNPNKMAYIIIPYTEKKESLEKVKMILKKIKKSDETIEQKIKYMLLNNNNIIEENNKKLEKKNKKENDENIIKTIEISKDIKENIENVENSDSIIKKTTENNENLEKFLNQFTTIPKKFIKDFYTISKENYKENEKVINFEKVSEWLNVRKEHLKRVLIKNFEKEYDYIENKKNVRHKKDNKVSVKKDILITFNCFKKICMLSQSEKAKEVRKYFIEMIVCP